MNKKFTNTDQNDSAVQVNDIVHQSDHLKRLIKQNQDTLEKMGNLMRLMFEKSTH